MCEELCIVLYTLDTVPSSKGMEISLELPELKVIIKRFSFHQPFGNFVDNFPKDIAEKLYVTDGRTVEDEIYLSSREVILTNHYEPYLEMKLLFMYHKTKHCD